MHTHLVSKAFLWLQILPLPYVYSMYMPLYLSNAPYPNHATITLVYPGILSVQTHFCMGFGVCAAHRNSN